MLPDQIQNAFFWPRLNYLCHLKYTSGHGMARGQWTESEEVVGGRGREEEDA